MNKEQEREMFKYCVDCHKTGWNTKMEYKFSVSDTMVYQCPKCKNIEAI